MTPPSIVINLSANQVAQMHELLKKMPPGGTCIAQVYAYDMRVKLLTFDQSIDVAKALGACLSDAGHSSAQQAQNHDQRLHLLRSA